MALSSVAAARFMIKFDLRSKLAKGPRTSPSVTRPPSFLITFLLLLFYFLLLLFFFFLCFFFQLLLENFFPLVY